MYHWENCIWKKLRGRVRKIWLLRHRRKIVVFPKGFEKIDLLDVVSELFLRKDLVISSNYLHFSMWTISQGLFHRDYHRDHHRDYHRDYHREYHRDYFTGITHRNYPQFIISFSSHVNLLIRNDKIDYDILRLHPFKSP